LEKDGQAKRRAARGARLSAALRENLKRRKAQARGRAAGSSGAEDQSQAAGEERFPAGSGNPDFCRNQGRE
jgi:hypothetical protein